MATRNLDGTLVRFNARLSLSELIDLYEMEEDEKFVKSTLECANVRKCGESFVGEGMMMKTFLSFNKSLCLGIKGTEELQRTFISRSLACALVSADAAALHNIEIVKNNNYPPDKKEYVEYVKNKATTRLANATRDEKDLPETPLNTFLYENPTNAPRIKFLKPVVLKQGILTTTADHEIGDIIAIDRPFFGASMWDSSYMNCSNCMKFSLFTLLPCDGCTTAMFCSEECKKEATKGYHQYECEVIDRVQLFFRDFYKVLMVFRQFFKALSICGGSVSELRQLLTKNMGRTILDFDYDSELFISDPKQHLIALFAFNNQLFPWSEARKKEEAIMYSKFLPLFPKLKHIWEGGEEKNFVLLFLISLSRYAYSSDFEYGAEPEQWIGGVYPLRSYMKNSCLPNVVGHIYDRCSVAYVAQEPISAGSRITVQHGVAMVEDWFYKRNTHYLESFTKMCNCIACVENFHSLMDQKNLNIMKVLARSLKGKLCFSRSIGSEQLLLETYATELKEIWKREPTMDMVKKWVGMSVYNVSQRETLNIIRHLTDLGESTV
ncbi:unnamed protein product [Diamesa hyperborea]